MKLVSNKAHLIALLNDVQYFISRERAEMLSLLGVTESV